MRNFNNFNIEAAVRLYYERFELSSNDIKEIFGDMSAVTCTRYKRKAWEQMAEDQTTTWSARNVNTQSAFTAWGLDIAELEKRLNKLRKLGFIS